MIRCVQAQTCCPCGRLAGTARKGFLDLLIQKSEAFVAEGMRLWLFENKQVYPCMAEFTFSCWLVREISAFLLIQC